MIRTEEELWDFSKKIAPEYPYSAGFIFNWFTSLINFEWRRLSEENLKDLLNERVVRGY